MKKSYFMYTFNLSIMLILISPFSFIFESLLNLTHLMSIITLTLVLILAVIEWVFRIHSDNFWNWFKSINQTLKLRNFMRQSEQTEKIVGGQKVTHSNPINDKFNRSVRQTAVDIHQNSIQVFIKIPRTQQAQKILKELESQIKEEISSQNSDFIFSNFERHKNQLWIQGTRK